MVVVTGISLASALGANLSVSWQNLLNGKSAIRLHQPFADLPLLPLAIINKTPADLTFLTQMLVTDALIDAHLQPPLLDCGVVIGSSRSYQSVWENLAQDYIIKNIHSYISANHHTIKGVTTQRKSTDADLERWLEILPYMPAMSSARQIGSIGQVLAPMAACATGIWSIAQGFELIKSGQCERVIAGAVETPITPLTLAGFRQMGALATTGAYPFDQHREGLVLGEGGAVLVLESAELAKKRGAKIYGEILGFGLTNDACYANSPSQDRKSAMMAVKKCLENSQILSSDIDYIHAHGTATQLNDYHEAQLIKYLFPQGVAVSSTKGATGHTLGASGVLGIAFSLMALQQQILPPCVGLKSTEFDLNFVKQFSLANIQRVLCLSFGFGGQNAAIALQKSSNNYL